MRSYNCSMLINARSMRKMLLNLFLVAFIVFIATDLLLWRRQPPEQMADYSIENAKLPVYWVNLNDSLTRRAHMKGVLQKLNPLFIQHNRVAAFGPESITKMIESGKLSLNGSFEIVTENKTAVDHAAEWNRRAKCRFTFTEIACLMSHLKAIETAHEDRVPVALIMEDDLELKADFAQHWTHIVDSAPPDWDILQMSTNNLLVMQHAVSLADPWISWQPDHYGTAAYFINQRGMRKLLQRTRMADRHWILDEQCIGVADEFIYFMVSTYFSTVPWFVQYDFGSEVQKNALVNERLYRKLFAQRNLMAAYEPPIRKREFTKTVLVLSVTLVTNITQSFTEYKALERDVYFLRDKHAKSAWKVLILSRTQELLDSVRTEFKPISSNVEFSFLLVHQRYNKFAWVSKWMHIMNSWDYVLLKDDDVSLTGFPWLSFFQAKGDAIVSSCLRSSMHEGLIRNLGIKSRQYFQIHEGNPWKRNRSPHYVNLTRVAVPFTEIYFALMIGPFAHWFFPQVLNQEFVEQPFDWGVDYAWCAAAHDWNASLTSCALVPAIALHRDTQTITLNRLEHYESSIPFLRKSKTYRRWQALSQSYRSQFGGFNVDNFFKVKQ